MRRLLAVLGSSVMLLAACGGSGDGDQQAAFDSGEAGGGDSAAKAVVLAAREEPAERDIVYTANVVVRVDDAEKAADEAATMAADAGGFVFAQSTDLEGDEEARLTLKVPSEQFDAAMDATTALGKVLQRESQAEDVTEQVVDLEGRLRTAQASADRLRGLIATAQSTGDVVSIEGELAKRETEIETLQGRLRVLTNQVDLATIELRLTERDDVTVSDDLPGFLDGLRTGWVVLVNLALIALGIVGFLLPFVPIVLVALLAARWWVRRRRPAPSPAVGGPR